MDKPVLITYLTSSKASWEVGEIMATELKKHDVKVDSIPAGKLETLEPYKMVILGAPIYMFMWPKDLNRFLTKHKTALSKLPTAVFSIGGSIEEGGSESEKARVDIQKALAKFPWFKPTTIRLFNINFSRGSAPFPFNLFQKSTPVEELMDWAALKAWVRQIAEV